MTRAELNQFIKDHLEDDLHRLLLSGKKYPGVNLPEVVTRIKALQKLKHKIPSWYNVALDLPLALTMEQASSEATALFKANLFSGQNMADLTGGLGVDCYFFSKAFKSINYVEQQEKLCLAAQHNFQLLNANNIKVQHVSAEAFLHQTNERFDLVYLDPARRDSNQNKVYFLSDCQPNIVALRKKILEKTDKILVKAAPMLDLTEAIRQLKTVSQVWVISVENECKELLFLVEKAEKPMESIPIHAISIQSEVKRWSFSKQQESEAQVQFDFPMQFLIEPDVAILKAGAFRSFAAQNKLSKLHPETHLYTSNNYLPEVMGRQFEVVAVTKYDAKSVAPFTPNGKANVSTRNFPDGPDQVKKNLKLKDGGAVYLFATTLSDGSKRVLICRKCIAEAG